MSNTGSMSAWEARLRVLAPAGLEDRWPGLCTSLGSRRVLSSGSGEVCVLLHHVTLYCKY